jgi:NADPH:quinone reductase-like Zn-dependent oxidoreductase
VIEVYREGRSGLGQALPLTLGSDVSGTVAALGAGVDIFARGDAVYGATNDQFVGGYTEYALVDAGKVAPKPAGLDYMTAAGLPVIAATAALGARAFSVESKLGHCGLVSCADRRRR